ncbi:C40 family peptidase [Mycobacterium sp.]|uniref:C40 family peptidase n=1 Tax=Mycobacterium sp. TaxID=1785 RepID=UPI0012802A23|nr:C40 family peptidase [Mycobacterium sp.]KAA8966474.1 MAG: NlpC/P60 family protein [Mycobacterium sp.]
MSSSELEVLSRACDLFAGAATPAPMNGAYCAEAPEQATEPNTGGGHELYRLAVERNRRIRQSSTAVDAAVEAVTDQARHDHAQARRLTTGVLDEARADTAVPDTPMAYREALRRRAARLRAQHAHVLTARRQARRHAAALRGLRYPTRRRRGGSVAGLRLPPPDSRAGIAVRAALSRLGRPYVWGASGPDRFDCSGLTQWSYAQAGLHLDRTTYEQIHDGIAVPRSQVRPGDLVFPHAGHVQMAIGNNLVVEAPHAGAAVQISPLGTNVQIRRPL